MAEREFPWCVRETARLSLIVRGSVNVAPVALHLRHLGCSSVRQLAGGSHRLCFRRALPKDASKRLLRPQRTQRPSCYDGTVTGDFDVHVEVASVEGVHFVVFSVVERKTMYRKPLLLFKLEEEAA